MKCDFTELFHTPLPVFDARFFTNLLNIPNPACLTIDSEYRCRSAVTDAVGLAPSLLPRPGAVAITVTTTALDRVSGVVCGDACVPGFGCGLAREGGERVLTANSHSSPPAKKHDSIC